MMRSNVAEATPHGVFAGAETIRDVRDVQRGWRRIGVARRRIFFRGLREILSRESERIARIIASETGKTPLEAISQEVIPALDSLVFLEKEAARILRPRPVRLRTRQFYFAGKKNEVRREPCGVIGILGAWNYPFFLSMSQALFALAAGNGVVLKGAPETPRVTAAVEELLEAAGLPVGLCFCFTGDAAAGEALCRAGCDKYILTGSAETGARVLGILAAEIRPAVMELSGCDAYCMLPDADFALAARTLLWGAFQYSGQTCVAPRRVFFLARDRDRFYEALRSEWRRARSFIAAQGRLIDARRAASERAKVTRLREMGATLVCGEAADHKSACVVPHSGKNAAEAADIKLACVVPHSGKNAAAVTDPGVFSPQVYEVSGDAGVEETGFMASVFFTQPCADEDEMLARANAGPYGLAASVWTSDRRRAERFVSELHAGVVWVNDAVFSAGLGGAPFGGVKRSGFGRTRGAEGLLEMTDCKFVSVDRGRRAALHLGPHRPGAFGVLVALQRFLYGTSFVSRIAALGTALRAAVEDDHAKKE